MGEKGGLAEESPASETGTPEKKQRTRTATAGIIDSQSVKTTDLEGDERGDDGGKKVNGRKRHILVDTLGLGLLIVEQTLAWLGKHRRLSKDYEGLLQ